MKKNLLGFLLFSLLYCFSVNAQLFDSISKKIDYVILDKNYYQNYYSKSNNISLFTIYELDSTKIKENKTYFSYFIEDNSINTSLNKYYKNSKYDRGHLFNAEDASFSDKAYLSSYLITNATPQLPEFNRGIWKSLEYKVRQYIENSPDKFLIISGCDLYEEKLKKLGTISIPKYFFKIVINLNTCDMNIYYIPNKYSNKKLSTFLITEKKFEKETGIYINTGNGEY